MSEVMPNELTVAQIKELGVSSFEIDKDDLFGIIELEIEEQLVADYVEKLEAYVKKGAEVLTPCLMDILSEQFSSVFYNIMLDNHIDEFSFNMIELFHYLVRHVKPFNVLVKDAFFIFNDEFKDISPVMYDSAGRLLAKDPVGLLKESGNISKRVTVTLDGNGFVDFKFFAEVPECELSVTSNRFGVLCFSKGSYNKPFKTHYKIPTGTGESISARRDEQTTLSYEFKNALLALDTSGIDEKGFKELLKLYREACKAHRNLTSMGRNMRVAKSTMMKRLIAGNVQDERAKALDHLIRSLAQKPIAAIED